MFIIITIIINIINSLSFPTPGMIIAWRSTQCLGKQIQQQANQRCRISSQTLINNLTTHVNRLLVDIVYRGRLAIVSTSCVRLERINYTLCIRVGVEGLEVCMWLFFAAWRTCLGRPSHNQDWVDWGGGFVCYVYSIVLFVSCLCSLFDTYALLLFRGRICCLWHVVVKRNVISLWYVIYISLF